VLLSRGLSQAHVFEFNASSQTHVLTLGRVAVELILLTDGDRRLLMFGSSRKAPVASIVVGRRDRTFPGMLCLSKALGERRAEPCFCPAAIAG
jgi:hypothetical protein